MNHRRPLSCLRIVAALAVAILDWHGRDRSCAGQEPPRRNRSPRVSAMTSNSRSSSSHLMKQYCERCHNADNMKSGIRVDQLSATPEDRQLFLWQDILRQVSDEAMPPSDELQPSDQRSASDSSEWIERTMDAAMTAQRAAKWIGPATDRVAIPKHAARFVEAR